MSGNVTQVVDGGIADVLLVAARGGDGAGLYAVDTTAAGTEAEPAVYGVRDYGLRVSPPTPRLFATTSDYRRHDWSFVVSVSAGPITTICHQVSDIACPVDEVVWWADDNHDRRRGA